MDGWMDGLGLLSNPIAAVYVYVDICVNGR